MSAKITLITPPDIFENHNKSLLFLHVSDQDQDIISKWLANRDLTYDVNFYIYTNEPNIDWLFWTLGSVKYKYIDIDNSNLITRSLAGFLLAKNDIYYKTQDENLAAIFSYINNNRIRSIETFLERAFGD